MNRFICLTVCALLLGLGAPGPLQAHSILKIGILAFQPKVVTLQNWDALASHLESSFADTSVEILPLTSIELEAAIRERQIDLVLTDPSQYIRFHHLYGLSAPLATVIRGHKDNPLHAFGGTMFTRAGNNNIESLEDLHGRTIAVPSLNSFDAWQMQQYELQLNGLSLLPTAQFVVTGMPHINVVHAVEEGLAEVGFVRAGILEQMAAEGSIDLEAYTVIHPQPFVDFPARVSTHLYPEWPLAALAHIDNPWRGRILAALLTFKSSGKNRLPFNVLGFTPPAEYSAVEELLRSLRAAPFDHVADIRLADIWNQYRVQILATAGALLIILLLSVYLFISRRQIRNAEASFRNYFEHDGLVKLIVEPHSGRLLDANDKAAQYYGYRMEALLKRSIFDLCVEPEHVCRERLRQVVEDQLPFCSFQQRLASEQIRDIEAYSARVWRHKKQAYILTVNDVSKRIRAERERDRLEAEVRQKFKMEALGVMAGGIAHNFNNSLAVILGGIELADLKRHDPEKVSAHLANAKSGVLRSRDLVKQILAYSRSESVVKEDVCMAQRLEESLQLLESTLPSSIKLIKDINPDCGHVTIQADPSLIHEVTFNLCNNAVQAMDEKGTLKVSFNCVHLEAEDIPAEYNCAPGSYACLSVQDSGCGMDSEQIGRIFDPFYTTKPVGKGTGLGLSSVQGMVIKHNGMIKVHSSPGEGSMVEVYFPLLEQDGSVSRIHTDGEEIIRGHENILLVDDEAMITDMCQQQLSELGYRVEAFHNSAEALRHFSSDAMKFDLVLTDQTMPGLSGIELAAAIRKVRPELPVIMLTGHSSKVDNKSAEALGINAFCMKPVEIKRLSRVIRNVLDAKK